MTGNSGFERVRIFDHGSQEEVEVVVPTQGTTFDTSSSHITITFLNDGRTDEVHNDVFLTSNIAFTVENEYRWNQWGCENGATSGCQQISSGELKWGAINVGTEEGGIYEVYFDTGQTNIAPNAPTSSTPTQNPTISNSIHTTPFLNIEHI